MKDYKIIALGSQCSGKSAIIKYLQDNTDFVCIDHDEEIKSRHDGKYPKDHVYVSNEVLPSIEDYVLDLPTVIYSASFWGLDKDGVISNEKINLAKEKGFKLVNLVTDRDVLIDRNKKRMSEGKADASASFDWYQRVYKNMDDLSQFDFKINTNGSIENSAKSLLAFIENI
ncbi:MAG: hypothetical protein HQ402_00745 [Parcubacteria group bacterium]|nr:hypothetical protein [Parcubacteria group bacterium]